MKYKIKEVLPNIFLAKFEDRFDLAMTFWRYQEHYESSSSKFRNKSFTLVDYMKWYAKNMGLAGTFSYPNDWAGFNIPSTIIDRVKELGIPDRNKYDDVMAEIYKAISQEISGPDFYLIGSVKGDLKTIHHEMAHGLWFSEKNYKKEMKENISNLKNKEYAALKKILVGYGYSKNVIEDEMQAFCSTGLTKSMRDIGIPKKLIKKFRATFDKYSNS